MNREIFLVPNEEEQVVVAELFRREQYRGLVRRNNILKGMPVADPFVVAAGKVHHGIVVTQESMILGGARIPTACNEMNIQCINLEPFFENENLQYYAITNQKTNFLVILFQGNIYSPHPKPGHVLHKPAPASKYFRQRR